MRVFPVEGGSTMAQTSQLNSDLSLDINDAISSRAPLNAPNVRVAMLLYISYISVRFTNIFWPIMRFKLQCWQIT